MKNPQRKSSKYLFVTYGEPGWRGVQMRAIRIAAYLPREEVLFWNGNDSSIIEEAGFRAETVTTGLSDPGEVIFPRGIEVVVFADLPTNELFSFSIFKAAIKRGIKTVICEQLYRKGQLKEGVFARFAREADLFLVNALSSFSDEESDTVKIVPPQVEYDPARDSKEKIREFYGIPKDAFLIFGSGYHEEVQKKIVALHKKLATKHPNLYTIISGSKKQKSRDKKNSRCIILPFQMGEEYIRLLHACDAAIVKFGFLQILESLALRVPTFVVGGGGLVLQQKEVIDKKIRDVVFFYHDSDITLYSDIDKIVTNVTFRNKVASKIKLLHNGELFGARKSAEEIRNLEARSSRALSNSEGKFDSKKKRLAVLINNEIFEKKEWLKKQEDVYPICFLVAMPTDKQVVKRFPGGLLEKFLKDLQIKQEGEILPHSFKEVYVFSKRKFDGLTDIFTWYETWVKRLQILVEEADEIYISEQGKKLLGPLLQGYKQKVKEFS